jgi:hypothetical protein
MSGSTPPSPLSGPASTSAAVHATPTTLRPNVAVIAIHGVGRHAPGSSAEDVAALLESIGREDNPAPLGAGEIPDRPYLGFRIKSIEIPLRAVYTEDLAEKRNRQRSASVAEAGYDAPTPANKRYQTGWLRKVLGVFDERRGFLAAQRIGDHDAGAQKRLTRPGKSTADEKFDYQFMLTQLAGYQGEPNRSFSTVRLESQRPPNAREPHVHIYDAHYSDLNKQQNSIVSFFFAFYQLLFHLGSLSLQAVYWAEAENTDGTANAPHPWPWRILSTLHAISIRLLIMFIPLLNLVLLAIGACAFADKLSPHPGAALGAGLVLSALLGLAFFLWIFRERGSPRRPWLWAALPLLCILVGSGFLAVLSYIDQIPNLFLTSGLRLLLLSWLVLAGVVIFLISRKFAEMRPGADWVAGVSYVINAAFFIGYFVRVAERGPAPAATAALTTVRVVFGELALCWLLCLVAALAAWLLGSLCVSQARRNTARQSRARAALRTGRFAFAIPASLFLVVTLALWSGVVEYGSHKLHLFDKVTTNFPADCQCATSFRFWIMPDACELDHWVDRLESDSARQSAAVAETRGPWDNYLEGLLLVSVSPGLPITLTLIGISFFLLMWAVLPSVLYEIWPQWTETSTFEKTRAAGNWFSRGMDSTAILIRVLWFAIVPVPLISGILHLLAWRGRLVNIPWLQMAIADLSRWTLPLIRITGTLLVVSAAAIVAGLLKYAGTILDTILDVDNYLRASPFSQTPRAAIAERCASLLRYIAALEDEQGFRYERLIIVAHSLGALVTADLLRFLKASAAPGVNAHDASLSAYGFAPGTKADIPIYLFTMGNPLRQLLDRFFPHLYAWVADEPDNSSPATELGDALEVSPKKIEAGASPDPEALSVKGWCNAYRSGDYVGRFLWLGPWLARNMSPTCMPPANRITDDNSAGSATRAEMCIGIGAHSHYWDRTAPDVATVLDALIKDPAQIF